MTVKLRPATDRDWHVFFGSAHPVDWFGLVAENRYMLIGIGGAYRGVDDHWWATFQRAPGVKQHKLLAQKAALETLRIADERALTLHAVADQQIEKSEYWLHRLGFERTEREEEGLPVWVRNSPLSHPHLP